MYYIPMGMVNGADVSSARYIAQSLVPSFIGNRGCLCVLADSVIGGCLLGIPMVLFHAPPALDLPLFRRRPSEATVAEHKDAATVTVATAPASPTGSVHDTL